MDSVVNACLSNEIRERSILHWNYRSYVEMPQELLDHGEHIQEIYLKENRLSDLPNELPLRCPNLTSLYLYSNELTRLHPSIGNMKHLTTLDLSRNKLRDLPPELGLATSLQTLDLSSNNLTSLPSTLGQLVHLEYLAVVSNGLKVLPDSIRGLHSLVALYAGLNEIQGIPEALAECGSLKDIYLNDNHIRNVPEALANKLTQLETLNLNNNELEFLPSTPFRSPYVRIIFHDNPRLHHINYILALQINTSYPSPKMLLLPDDTTFKFPNRGCFVPAVSIEDTQRAIILSDSLHGLRHYLLHFPPSIHILDSRNLVPSLLELSLRSTYTLLSPPSKRNTPFRALHPPEQSELPNILNEKLRSWSALCSTCGLPLFNEMSLSLLRVSFRPDATGEAALRESQGFASLHFCSESCRNTFKSSKHGGEDMIIDF